MSVRFCATRQAGAGKSVKKHVKKSSPRLAGANGDCGTALVVQQVKIGGKDAGDMTRKSVHQRKIS
jgi:hypothetical protein